MAKRTPTPQERQPANLSAEQMRAAIPVLNDRIKDLEAFDPQSVQDRKDPRIKTLEIAIDEALADIFGSNSIEYRRYQEAKHIDTAGYNYAYGTPLHEVQAGLVRGKDRALAILRQIIRSLEEKLQRMGSSATALVARPAELSDDVFIVHGHDEQAREEVARLITRCGLNPIILNEQASGARTVIEKLERYSNVSFAVVLLTPDDVGGPAPKNVAGVTNLNPRARQNVIAELFYFIGKLGRDKVCALKKGEIEIPSDIGGVVYTPMDAGGGWKMALLKELGAAGHEIDWRKALG